MIVFDIKVNRTGIAEPGFPRAFRGFVREALKDAARYWGRHILPKHFKPKNRAEYQHQPRDPEYVEDKREFGTGQGRFVDLLLKGKSRRWAMHGQRVTGTSQGARIRVDVPAYFTRPKELKPGSQPDKKAELKRVSAADKQRLADFIEGELIFALHTRGARLQGRDSRGRFTRLN